MESQQKSKFQKEAVESVEESQSAMQNSSRNPQSQESHQIKNNPSNKSEDKNENSSGSNMLVSVSDSDECSDSGSELSQNGSISPKKN